MADVSDRDQSPTADDLEGDIRFAEKGVAEASAELAEAQRLLNVLLAIKRERCPA